ncbi:MAG: hypothetical protein WCN27_00550 [Alphaproteobacteria bacterium]
MQITTVHKLQLALDTLKKVIKLVWRHLLILGAFGITIQVMCEGHIPNLKGTALVLVIALFFDWFKMQFKSTSNIGNLACEQMFESSRRNMDDFSWKMNPLNTMGYTHHTYNHRSTNNYY